MAKSPSGSKGGTTHVVPNPSGGWSVKLGGNPTPVSNHRTKVNAETAGRRVSRAAESELKIHNLNGQIARSDSHGNDPRGTKG